MSPMTRRERVVIELRHTEDGTRLWRCACSDEWHEVRDGDHATRDAMGHGRDAHGSDNVWFRAEASTEAKR